MTSDAATLWKGFLSLCNSGKPISHSICSNSADGGGPNKRPTGSCLEINVGKLKVSETECGSIVGVAATITKDLQVHGIPPWWSEGQFVFFVLDLDEQQVELIECDSMIIIEEVVLKKSRIICRIVTPNIINTHPHMQKTEIIDTFDTTLTVKLVVCQRSCKHKKGSFPCKQTHLVPGIVYDLLLFGFLNQHLGFCKAKKSERWRIQDPEPSLVVRGKKRKVTGRVWKCWWTSKRCGKFLREQRSRLNVHVIFCIFSFTAFNMTQLQKNVQSVKGRWQWTFHPFLDEISLENPLPHFSWPLAKKRVDTLGPVIFLWCRPKKSL